MPPLKTPNAELLRLGAGQLFYARWDENGVALSFDHIGNLDSLEITETPDILLKKSTMTAGRPTYKKITRSIETVLRAVGNEFSMENLALMFMGTIDYTTQTATPITAQILVANVPTGTLGSILGGSFLFVGKFNIDTVSMDLGAAALDADDFEVWSAQMGVIRIKETSATVTNGTDDLTIDYTPQAITGTDAPVVHGGTVSEIQGSLVYFEDNSAGENHILRVWSASATPDGAMGLIQDDFGTFTLSFTLQDDSAGLHGGSDASPLFDYQFVPAPAA